MGEMEKEERKAPRSSRNRARMQHLFFCLYGAWGERLNYQYQKSNRIWS